MLRRTGRRAAMSLTLREADKTMERGNEMVEKVMERIYENVEQVDKK